MQMLYPAGKFCSCKNCVNGMVNGPMVHIILLYYYPNQSGVSLASQTGDVIKYSRGEARDHQVRNECDDGTVYCTQPSPPLTTFY